MAESYFSILGISSDASTQEVKNAYHRLVQQYHPDHGGGDSRKFMAVQEAYNVLRDPEQRRRCRQRESFGERVPVRVVRTQSAKSSAGGFSGGSAQRKRHVWSNDESGRTRSGHVWSNETDLRYRDFDMEFEELFKRMLRTFFS